MSFRVQEYFKRVAIAAARACSGAEQECPGGLVRCSLGVRGEVKDAERYTPEYYYLISVVKSEIGCVTQKKGKKICG